MLIQVQAELKKMRQKGIAIFVHRELQTEKETASFSG